MASPLIKIKRGSTAPSSTLSAGEFAIDQSNQNLYLGIDDGVSVSNVIIAGEGTFATKTFVADAIEAVTDTLGTMSTQDADSVAITGGTIDGTAIGQSSASTGIFTGIESTDPSLTNKFVGPTEFTWGLKGSGVNPVYVSSTLDLSIGSGIIELGSMGVGAVRGLGEPVNDNDAARKKYVDDKVAALGSVFRYKGTVGQFSNAPGNRLQDLPDQNAGAYYLVDFVPSQNGEALAFEDGNGGSWFAKVGDAFVMTSQSGWQKLDNVDVVVSGTDNEVTVTGDENTGYTVALATAFKSRVSNVELKTQNIDLASTSAGATKVNGNVDVAGRLSSCNENFVVNTSRVDFSNQAVYIGGSGAKLVGVDDSGVTPYIENINHRGAFKLSSAGVFSSPDFEVTNGGEVRLNQACNSAAVQSYGTFNISSAGGQFTDSGSPIALKANGNLVGVNNNFGVPYIENFIIDGGNY